MIRKKIDQYQKERENITTYSKDNKWIVAENNFYSNKLENLDEMDRFLEKHKLPNTQKERDNLNSIHIYKKKKKKLNLNCS